MSSATLSWIAIGVSLVSILWNVVDALHLDKARLKVTVTPMVLLGEGAEPQMDAIVVQVTNVGKRPTTLTQMSIVIGSTSLHDSRLVPRRIKERLKPIHMIRPRYHYPGWPVSFYSDPIPRELVVGGRASLFYPTEVVTKNLEDLGASKVVGTATATTCRGRTKPYNVTKALSRARRKS